MGVINTFCHECSIFIFNDIHLFIDRSSTPFILCPPILTLNKHADDQSGLWLSRGAGQCTDEKLQTVRDPTSLSAQR